VFYEARCGALGAASAGFFVTRARRWFCFSKGTIVSVCKGCSIDEIRLEESRAHIMRNPTVFKMFRNALVRAICTSVLCVVLCSRLAWAEEDGFVLEDPKKVKAEPTPRESKVFSFGRFEPVLRDICREMELDGRRTKLVQLSEIGRKGHADCASCRALWKSVYWACRDSAVLDTKEAPKGKKKKKQGESQEGEGATPTEEATPVPTPTPKPLQRYPTTVMLDLTSRLSVSLFSQDPGDGGYYEALQSFSGTLTRDPSLTPGERDYYSVFVSFLMASWEDRDDPAAQETPHSKEELNAIFE
jgi:hypothetical protein